jgi:pimeloyl-ACP methyl ester carboxylesterase
MGQQHLQTAGRYAQVNGLRMYYETHGEGRPLVLVHGGGSTIESNFGRVLPALARAHRVVAVELQAHGHTADVDRPYSFEQDADDIAALLAHLRIPSADLLGFSNGGMTSLQVAIRHPKVVKRLVLASALFKREGMQPGFWEGLEHATLADMPAPLKAAYLKANPDPEGLGAMFDRDRRRMLDFRGFPEADIRAIEAPALVLGGDRDVIRVEHLVELARTLPRARLAILPGGHGDYIGEACAPEGADRMLPRALGIIEDFLTE